MEAIAGKRLVLFAGKGGVGKTTCSSAAALRLARSGRRTLLVTVDPAKRLEDSLGVPVGSTETPIQPNLAALMLDPSAVIKEHLEREVPQARITEHPLFNYVTQYLPGLNELMAIGKLNDIRRAGKYDCIVVDTAPTGHALSFLSAPKAIEELMGDRSLVRWALRGYAVWQRVSGAARGVAGLFRKRDEPPPVDLERIFTDIHAEARRIRAFLTDPEHSALVVVTIPEKLPVEETCDLHEALTRDLGMRVAHVVVNKVQPDPLSAVRGRFDAISGDPAARSRFVAGAAKGTGEPPELVDALLEASRFAEVRRAMNVGHIADLRQRLPDVPISQVPLFERDVQGLKRLAELEKTLFDPANMVQAGAGSAA